MGRRSRVVGPVVDRGDAGVRAFSETKPDAPVEVLCAVKLRRRRFGREVAEAAVTHEIPAERAPYVVMRLDEAWHDDHIGSVNYLSARYRKIGADGLDAAFADVDIAAR